jgi:hypothetical protein
MECAFKIKILSIFLMVIQCIDSVLIGDDYRLRFNLNNPDGPSNWIIEGLGHEKGFIEPMYTLIEGASEFYCYAENHILIFQEGVYCDLAVYIHENTIKNQMIQVYPNPSKSIVTVAFSCNEEKIINFKIVGMIGNVIIDASWYARQGLNEKTYDLSIASPGMYFIILNDGNSMRQKKIILAN